MGFLRGTRGHSRIFDGEYYYFKKWFSQKGEAQGFAKGIRSRGNKARVTRSGRGGYEVWAKETR